MNKNCRTMSCRVLLLLGFVVVALLLPASIVRAGDVQVDSVYLGVVDCAVPPVTFSSMSSAFGDGLVDGFTSMLADTAAGRTIMLATYQRVRKTVNPDADLKTRLARYFQKLFTPAEAAEIVASCQPETGFSNKDLFSRFQESISLLSPYAQQQALVVTTNLIGSFMKELSKDLETTTPEALGYTK